MSVFVRRSGGIVWSARIAVGAALAGGLATALVGVSSASVTHSHAKATSAVVVNVAKRTVGTKTIKMLVVHGSGMALYINPKGCNAACQQIWPPLLMPSGATVPTGSNCLATVPFGTNQLQVTYRGQPLYTFVQDSGHSVNGNGVAGFTVAKHKTTACP